MKKAVWEWLNSDKKWLEANPLPTDDEIRACAYGQINLDCTRQLYLFKWWWTALLPRVVGKQQWGPQVHLYTTISKATTIISGKEEKLFTSSTLALAVALYENNYTKWKKIHEFEQDQGGNATQRAAKGKNIKYPVYASNHPIKEERGRTLKEYRGKWSNAYGGKKEIDGFSDQGRKMFTEYRKQIKTTMEKKQEDLDALEEFVLGQLRDLHDIVAPDHAAQKKSKKRKQAAVGVPEDPPVETYNSDEDE
jgi:hypothetical protein